MTTAYYRIDGRRLAQARVNAFLTQGQLAEKSGISLATVQGIEQPRRSRRYTAGQRPYTVIALANAVGITPRDLLCITSPQVREVGKPPDTEPDTEHGEGASQARQEHATPRVKALDLGFGLEPQPHIAEGKDLSRQAAPESNGKGKHLADLLNLGLVTSLLDRYPSWAKRVTFALLQGLATGGKHSPAYGARAVNAAIEDLYENAAGVSNPSGYLRERAQAHADSQTERV